MLSVLSLGFLSKALRACLAGFLALMVAACGASNGKLDELNAPGVKPGYFVDGQQIVPAEGARLATLDGEILQHFNIVLVVNKGAKGEHSQSMMVMRPDTPGCGGCAWSASDIWEVSTGRELEEKYFTTTPTGIYQLDQTRFYRDYNTTTWDDAPMPFSMFWRYLEDGEPTGWAVHAASEKLIKNLGKRNSGGCIRLHPTNARALFEELMANHRGQVPVFDWNEREGEVVRTEDGAMQMTRGLKVLLVVDDGGDLSYIKAELPSSGFEVQTDESDAEKSDAEESEES